MLALGLALALTFGMTVCAAESPEASADVVKATEAAGITEATAESLAAGVGADAIVVNGVSVKPEVTAVNPATVYLAKEAAKAKVNADAQVVAALNITAPAGFAGGDVTIDMGAKFSSNSNYCLLHWTGTEWERIDIKSVNGSKVTAYFKTLSPVAIVNLGEDEPAESADESADQSAAQSAGTAPVSPKTAETLPVAGVMALICLAGAAVCANKIRYNK